MSIKLLIHLESHYIVQIMSEGPMGIKLAGLFIELLSNYKIF